MGCSEMVLEDFAGDLTASARHDIDMVLGEVRGLLTAIDTLFDTRDAAEAAPDIAEVTALAEGLECALSQTQEAQEAREAFAGTIFVIDDEAVNREILIRQLERKGHSIRAASSARQALEALTEERFDLALLDILMPDVNGIEILQRIKHEAVWREMPVAMVSGLMESSAIARCISIGAEITCPNRLTPYCCMRSRWSSPTVSSMKRTAPIRFCTRCCRHTSSTV